MRHTLLVLVVVLVAGSTQVRADQIVAYNMTGTITQAWSSSSFAVGDHITWTFQYVPSTPGSFGSSKNASEPWKRYWMPHTNTVTNIVDQTTGYHFPLLPPSDVWEGGMGLSKDSSSSGNMWAYENANGRGMASSVQLLLMADTPHPTVNLAEFQLNNLHMVRDPIYSSLQYNYSPEINVQYGFSASVDSISSPLAAQAPEPASLTLFFLGAAGLAARGIRRSLRQLG